jgi:hypothetical protein
VQSVVITSGDTAREMGDGVYHVSKSNLVTALMDLVQRKRLKILEGVKDFDAFFEQLDGFGYKVNSETRNLTYEAMKERIHDDLVISTALAVWYAERVRPYIFHQDVETHREKEYDPLRDGLE